MAATSIPNLGNIARAEYQALFHKEVAQGLREPLVLPFCLLGPFLLPTIYLAIPHRNRPWLYHARWLIVAFVIVFDLYIVRHMSSYNVATAYAAGLMGIWGILANLNLLVWTNPQADYARIIRVPKDKETTTSSNGNVKNDTLDTNGIHENGLRQRKSYANANALSGDIGTRAKHQDLGDTVCVWQRFPENGTLGQRLNWTLDLATNFREVGWNCCITSVPRPEIPTNIRDGDPVSFKDMPVVSKSGYYRNLTEREFVWTRLRNVFLLTFVLDFCSVMMVKDPYCTYGPDRDLPPPLFLQQLSPWLLQAYRELLCLIGIYAAIDAIFNLHDLFQYYVFSYVYPMRGELWQYTNIFGPVSQILDRGIAGWWGAFWHQTFRLQFISPAKFLVDKGYLQKGSLATQVVTMYVSFIQSGLLHGAGSISSMPETKPWRAPVFFFLQPLGIIIQLLLLHLMDKAFPNTPRGVRQVFNAVSTAGWLYYTAFFFTDDISSSGIWLLEPVPISPLRWLGFGHPDDHWWRWERYLFPIWHSDKHWWKSGFQI
ncbi:uncharacterized protein FIESC28_04568 [Fusarium coffeatum]|uniref:Wax synthase domain-containing protein n=1 Tax=Fusarium coffeatum TaxID=231269 RepID=A0A366RYT1_9HYPO|nr:uncharacterized protein FIESC28_04568 [Fusarium coffeatum]RBR22239.1 hypothetical protein FIESC28_04568 [Fusarium coffeatum]